MSTPADDDLKRSEEEKRERNWDPVRRWQAFLETIAWLDSQAPVGRNTRARCLELQRAKLAAMGEPIESDGAKDENNPT